MGLTQRDRQRLAVGKVVSKLSALSDFAKLFTIQDDQGTSIVVPAIEDDSLVFVARLVRRAGGRATVVVLGHSDADKSLRLGIASITVNYETADGDHDLPVGPRCTVGELFRILMPGASATFRLNHEELEIADLIEGPVPDETSEGLKFAADGA